MSNILGIEKLHSLLSQDQLEKLDKAAQRHTTESNMSFVVLSATEKEIQVETTQGETKSGKYATEATLINRTKELFAKILPNVKFVINPVPFAPSPASTVTTAWLENQMEKKGIRIKQIAFDAGIDRESISDWVTGKRPMSQLVKAMFYFYFSK